jgi:predicted nucleotide-binding protein (sugar kinase/HSP70/actin superfamily)
MLSTQVHCLRVEGKQACCSKRAEDTRSIGVCTHDGGSSLKAASADDGRVAALQQQLILAASNHAQEVQDAWREIEQRDAALRDQAAAAVAAAVCIASLEAALQARPVPCS